MEHLDKLFLYVSSIPTKVSALYVHEDKLLHLVYNISGNCPLKKDKYRYYSDV